MVGHNINMGFNNEMIEVFRCLRLIWIKITPVGAPGANRTRDPWLRRPILYPLSYGRI